MDVVKVLAKAHGFLLTCFSIRFDCSVKSHQNQKTVLIPEEAAYITTAQSHMKTRTMGNIRLKKNALDMITLLHAINDLENAKINKY